MRNAIDIKYPWVSVWLKTLEAVPAARAQQANLDKYLDMFMPA